MMILKFILFVSLGVLSSATEDDACEEILPDHCFAGAPDVPLDFPDSEEALDKLCPMVLPRLKCVLDYKKKCPDTALSREGLETNIENLYAVIVEACDKDSELNKGLAIHLPCIEENMKGHRAACNPMIDEIMEEVTSNLNLDWDAEDVFPNDEARVKYGCTRESLDMSCLIASTNVKCGEEAGEIAVSIVDRIGFFDAICPENIRGDMKALLSIVQPLMELGLAVEDMVSKIK